VCGWGSFGEGPVKLDASPPHAEPQAEARGACGPRRARDPVELPPPRGGRRDGPALAVVRAVGMSRHASLRRGVSGRMNAAAVRRGERAGGPRDDRDQNRWADAQRRGRPRKIRACRGAMARAVDADCCPCVEAAAGRVHAPTLPHAVPFANGACTRRERKRDRIGRHGARAPRRSAASRAPAGPAAAGDEHPGRHAPAAAFSVKTGRADSRTRCGRCSPATRAGRCPPR
jgi:hypothetical protein